MTATLDAAVVAPPATRSTRPPRAQVADMACSLDFYLRLGCEVGRAADGWVLLRCAAVSFVLVQAPPRTRTGPPPPVPDPDAPWVRLVTGDVRALRRRLLGDDVPVGALHRPARAPEGQIDVVDPDRRPVAIEQRTTDQAPPTAP